MHSHSEAFDVIPYDDIKGPWKKLGSGSFGNVYKGSYLGIDVAIKEVLPSNDYDVAKYFEREWRLMKEARHPNVVLYLGLSRAPDPDGRIYIISEFIDGGNLRSYIYDKTNPFPWRLRVSFATDIARALAYLHARKCIHRDLKGENLLVTANGRLKITDFGFARIAARNEEESKRLTFCGTDSYMSPEILLGHEFDLPTDIFSLGVIFAEIASRKLASDSTFKRTPPTFGIDTDEVRHLASEGCPSTFLQLILDCIAGNPASRPTTRVILDRLRDIEAEVLARSALEEEAHVGSIKFLTGAKRPGGAPRIPSFGMGAGQNSKPESSGEESSDEELAEALDGLKKVDLEASWGNISDASSAQPLISDSNESEYSTTVVRAHPPRSASPPPLSLSSILTVRPIPELNPNASDDLTSHPLAVGANGPTPAVSALSIESYHTASSSHFAPSIAAATEGSGLSSRISLVHRFTLLRPGGKRGSIGPGQSGSASPPRLIPGEGMWNPLDFFFTSTLLGAKCDVCMKRFGWKPLLECDDCGLRAHIKCGEVAPMDCGIRPARSTTHVQVANTHTGSPNAKLKNLKRNSTPTR